MVSNSQKHSFFLYSGVLSLALGIFSFSMILFTQVWLPEGHLEKKDLISPPKHLDKMSFGYSEALADLMWIRTIQDLDYCDQQISEKVCQNNSWLYEMLETTTNLSPSFRMPYAAGALALTIIITDIDGATKIFDKGVKYFPQDWPLLFRAAYHYLYEVKDKKRAAELLRQAGLYGAPPWVFTLSGRLYSDSGNIELAEAVLQQMISTEKDPILIQRLREKILQVKAERR